MSTKNLKIVGIVTFICFSIAAISYASNILVRRGNLGGGVFSASDNFNRSNSDSLGALSGGTYTWTEQSGDIDIESNQAHLGINSASIATIGADESAGYAQIDIVFETSSYEHHGVVFWYEDNSNYWYAELTLEGNDILTLYEVNSGTPTDRGNYDYSGSLSLSTPYEIKVTYSSSAVTVDVDSVQRINYTGSFSESGDLGIYLFRSGAATGYCEDFEAGEQICIN